MQSGPVKGAVSSERERRLAGRLAVWTFPEPSESLSFNSFNEVFANNIGSRPWVTRFRFYDVAELLFVPLVHCVYDVDGVSKRTSRRAGEEMKG